MQGYNDKFTYVHHTYGYTNCISFIIIKSMFSIQCSINTMATVEAFYTNDISIT